MSDNGFFFRTVYSSYEKRLMKEVLEGAIPNHVGIIMDGNRRYAREVLGDDVTVGHKLGEKKIESVMDWCLDLGIKYVTLYAFSTENFNRASTEVDFLMELAAASFMEMADNPKIHANHVRIRAIGNLSDLPQNVIDAIEYANKKTETYDNHFITICIAYGGRQEIASVVRDIAYKVKSGEMEPEDIDEKVLSSMMYTSDMPDPDLILRTSGEMRISNFLLWQIAYSELYFTDVYWPDFRCIDLLRAIRTYQQRKRRYGK
ncbi:MAG: polyprenyl diphosphate synthase [archaeon]|nr:polyprenyl diphosphate synthase [archaeon]